MTAPTRARPRSARRRTASTGSATDASRASAAPRSAPSGPPAAFAPALSWAYMTGGPEVHPDRVVFRLEDRGFTCVQLQQELERPRSGPPFARSGGDHWELEYRRP